ncbi:MAG: glycosyltransferase [Candidatus Levyibacteriota bacterium]
MKNLPSISIGIPAYNEAKNIKKLLKSLLQQREVGFRLESIIVASDGSSDATDKEVKSLKDKRIALWDDHKRLGKSARLNELFRKNTADILILADADIQINDTNLLSILVKESNFQHEGIVSVNVTPIKGKTFVENSLNAGVFAVKQISENWRNGNNYLSFKGCFLALDKNLVKKIHMPTTLVNNDAFLYFSALVHNYKPAYRKNCVVYYRSPATLDDHLKQSSRFKSSSEELKQYFKMNLEKEYKAPIAIMMSSILQSLIKRPVFFLAYLGINSISHIKKQTNIKSTWSIASSTKQ